MASIAKLEEVVTSKQAKVDALKEKWLDATKDLMAAREKVEAAKRKEAMAALPSVGEGAASTLLPYEVWANICTHCHSYRGVGALCELALVNKAISKLAMAQIWRDIDVKAIRGPDKARPKAGVAKSITAMSETIEKSAAEHVRSFKAPLGIAKAPFRKGVPLMIEAISTNPKRLANITYSCDDRAVEAEATNALGLIMNASDTITSLTFTARSANAAAWQLVTSIIDTLPNLTTCQILEESFYSRALNVMSKPSVCKAISKATKLKSLTLALDPVSDLKLIQVSSTVKHVALVFDQSLSNLVEPLHFLDQIAATLTSLHLVYNFAVGGKRKVMPDDVFDLPAALASTDQYPQLEKLQVSVERGRDPQLQCSKILPTVLAHFDQSLGHIKEFVVCDNEAPGLMQAFKEGRMSDLTLLGAPKGVVSSVQIGTMANVKCYEIQKYERLTSCYF